MALRGLLAAAVLGVVVLTATEASGLVEVQRLLKYAAEALEEGNHLAAAEAVAAAWRQSPGDATVEKVLREQEQQLVQQGLFEPLGHLYQALIDTSTASFGDLVEYSYVAPLLNDSARVSGLIEQFLRVPGMAQQLQPNFVAKVHFALARLHDNQGHWNRAFGECLAGNKVAQHLEPRGSPAAAVRDCLNLMDAVKTQFNRTRLADLPRPDSELGPAGRRHVFVVGFPRSGTSLVDQVLAAHPQVYSRGENSELQQAAAWLVQQASSPSQPLTRGVVHWPKLTGPPERLFEELLTAPPRAVDAVARVLDEMWRGTWAQRAFADGNVTHVVSSVSFDINLLWLLPTFFPGAKVVFVVRDPRDVLLSNLCTGFVLRPSAFCGLHFALRPPDAAHTLNRFAELRRHWQRNISPWAGVLEVRYEALVRDKQATIRRLLEFVGLDLDAAAPCFAHETRPRWRGVSTASVNQVQLPVFSTRAERWLHYQNVELFARAVADLHLDPAERDHACVALDGHSA